MSAVLSNGSKLLNQKTGIVSIAYVRIINNYSTENKTYNLTQLKRGTGGRSSFNGIVATVFGCTGFIGGYVCNRLGKIGTQLILPYRGDPYEAQRLKLCGDLGQVLFHPIHLQDEESIEKAVKYSNVVINLIGRDWETRNFSFDDVHVKGARLIARAAKNAGVERLIHLSALNAVENPVPHMLKSGSKFLASKYHGEEAVLDEFPEATIFRPSDVYGQEDRFLRYYAHIWRRHGSIVPLYKKGECTIKQPVHVSDLAAGIVAAVREPETAGKIYQAVGPRRYHLSELVDWFYRVMRKGPEWGYIRSDSRYDPLFWLKVSLTGKFSPTIPIGNMHWERVERECITDTVVQGIPSLEDLGVNLTKMEDQVAWELKPFFEGLYRGEQAEEPPSMHKPPKFVV